MAPFYESRTFHTIVGVIVGGTIGLLATIFTLGAEHWGVWVTVAGLMVIGGLIGYYNKKIVAAVRPMFGRGGKNGKPLSEWTNQELLDGLKEAMAELK